MGGTINFINKEQADILLSLGFRYTEQKINSEQMIYSFIDTPEIIFVFKKLYAVNIHKPRINIVIKININELKIEFFLFCFSSFITNSFD